MGFTIEQGFYKEIIAACCSVIYNKDITMAAHPEVLSKFHFEAINYFKHSQTLCNVSDLFIIFVFVEINNSGKYMVLTH